MTDVGDLLALDPSIVSPGIALFRDGVLQIVERVRFKVDTSLNPSLRCLVAANEVVMRSIEMGFRPITLVHEWPQIYAPGKTKGDQNDLPYMAGVNLAVAAHLQMTGRRLTVCCYTAAEWIGQVPKFTRGSAKESPRAKRILGRLSLEERTVVPDQHDAIDAVGLGLHALGRLGVRRALSSR